ncbi:MAG TPA: hypothetical protein V6C95_10400 [Coleofasciculaceae cyanobacterium]
MEQFALSAKLEAEFRVISRVEVRTMTVAVEIRRLSVEDYHRMVEAGILTPDEQKAV